MFGTSTFAKNVSNSNQTACESFREKFYSKFPADDDGISGTSFV